MHCKCMYAHVQYPCCYRVLTEALQTTGATSEYEMYAYVQYATYSQKRYKLCSAATTESEMQKMYANVQYA